MKRWPISQKRRTQLYDDISEEIMQLRIGLQGNNKDTADIDGLLFKLNQQIWRKVCATLRIPT